MMDLEDERLGRRRRAVADSLTHLVTRDPQTRLPTMRWSHRRRRSAPFAAAYMGRFLFGHIRPVNNFFSTLEYNEFFVNIQPLANFKRLHFADIDVKPRA